MPVKEIVNDRCRPGCQREYGQGRRQGPILLEHFEDNEGPTAPMVRFRPSSEPVVADDIATSPTRLSSSPVEVPFGSPGNGNQ